MTGCSCIPILFILFFFLIIPAAKYTVRSGVAPGEILSDSKVGEMIHCISRSICIILCNCHHIISNEQFRPTVQLTEIVTFFNIIERTFHIFQGSGIFRLSHMGILAVCFILKYLECRRAAIFLEESGRTLCNLFTDRGSSCLGSIISCLSILKSRFGSIISCLSRGNLRLCSS